MDYPTVSCDTHRRLTVNAAISRPTGDDRTELWMARFQAAPIGQQAERNATTPDYLVCNNSRRRPLFYTFRVTVRGTVGTDMQMTESIPDRDRRRVGMDEDSIGRRFRGSRSRVSYANRSDGDPSTEPSAEMTAPAAVVGIPAYNEAGSIADVVSTARRHADAVIVVDDGSEDRTDERARRAGAIVIRHGDNRGYGSTLRTIFERADAMGAEQLVILDGDGQHDPNDVPKLLDAQRSNGAEIVVGSRFAGGSETDLPTYRRLGLAVVNAFASAGIWLRYSTTTAADTQSGFRAYGPEAIETFAYSSDVGSGMEASLDILFHAAQEGFEIEEVPVTIDYDIDHPSSQHPVTHGLTLLKAILVELLSERPVRIAIGAVLAGITFLLAVGVFGLLGGRTTHAVGFLAGGLATALLVVYTNAARTVFGFDER